jgi:hypothetical protein
MITRLDSAPQSSSRPHASPSRPTRLAAALGVGVLLMCALAPHARAVQSSSSSGAAVAQPPAPRLLETVFEVQDGDVQDVAGTRVAPANPSWQRVWLAQGRVRAAIAAGTRERKSSEDRTFDALSAGHHEKVIAVEVGSAGPLQYLYTLTELERGEKVLGTYDYRAAVYREQISAPYSPARPGNLVFAEVPVDLIPAPNPGDARQDKVQDVRPWPADGKLVVSTNYALHVYDDAPSALTWRARTNEFVDAWSAALAASAKAGWLGWPSCTASPEKVSSLTRFKLADENGAAPGGVIAYCIASPIGYCAKPFPRVILLADVSAGNWNAPTFDADPGANQRFVYWNPADKPAGLNSGCTDLTPATCTAGTCPTCTKQNGELVPAYGVFDAFTCYDLDPYVDPTQPGHVLRAWVACGTERQAQRLELTNAFTNPGHAWNALRVNVGATAPLFKVLADPTTPQHRFYAQTIQSTHIAQWDGLGFIATQLNGENFGEDAGERDIALLDLPETSGTSRVLWTAGTGLCDWVHKLTEVTPGKSGLPKLYDPPSTPAVDPQKLPWVAASDGAAAIIEPAAGRATIYLPTFGGMIRWDPATLPSGRPDYTRWIQQTNTFLPSKDPQLGGVVPTEQVDVPPLVGAQRRFVSAIGSGGFIDWPIQDATLAFTLGSLIYQVPAWAGAAGWPAVSALQVYGHDAVSFTHGGNTYVAADLTRQDNDDVALQVFRFVPGSSTPWCLTGVFVQKELLSVLGLPPLNYSLHVSIHTLETGNKPLAFVGFKGGFVAFDLTPALTCPSGAAPVHVYGSTNPLLRILPPPPSGAIYEVWGVDRMHVPGSTEDRLVVACDKGQIDTGVFVYALDGASGVTGATPLWQSNLAFFPLGVPLVGALKLRSILRDAQTGARELFIADRAGYLFQARWDPAAPNTLDYVAHWKSDYVYLVNDCRPYDFGAPLGWMLLCPKDRESFAWVRPYLGP